MGEPRTDPARHRGNCCQMGRQASEGLEMPRGTSQTNGFDAVKKSLSVAIAPGRDFDIADPCNIDRNRQARALSRERRTHGAESGRPRSWSWCITKNRT